MIEKEFLDLRHAGTNDLDSFVGDLVFTHDESFDVGKGTNGVDVDVSDVGVGEVELLSLGCDQSVFESDLLGNVVGVVLGELILEGLKLFLGNLIGTLRDLLSYLSWACCYLMAVEF
jgi:hypothetical protein